LREMVKGAFIGAGSARTSREQRSGAKSKGRIQVEWSDRRKAEHDDATSEPGRSRLVLESLKARVRELEEVARGTPRCLICLEPYRSPLTSIVCWHVHCEECWLQTLGTKKLCPQCMKITSPVDLRKIYL